MFCQISFFLQKRVDGRANGPNTRRLGEFLTENPLKFGAASKIESKPVKSSKGQISLPVEKDPSAVGADTPPPDSEDVTWRRRFRILYLPPRPQWTFDTAVLFKRRTMARGSKRRREKRRRNRRNGLGAACIAGVKLAFNGAAASTRSAMQMGPN